MGLLGGGLAFTAGRLPVEGRAAGGRPEAPDRDGEGRTWVAPGRDVEGLLGTAARVGVREGAGADRRTPEDGRALPEPPVAEGRLCSVGRWLGGGATRAPAVPLLGRRVAPGGVTTAPEPEGRRSEEPPVGAAVVPGRSGARTPPRPLGVARRAVPSPAEGLTTCGLRGGTYCARGVATVGSTYCAGRRGGGCRVLTSGDQGSPMARSLNPKRATPRRGCAYTTRVPE